MAQTKLSWYVLPAIPLFAVITGIVIDQISGVVSGVLKQNKQAVAIVLVIAFSMQPTMQAFNHMLNQEDDLSKDNFYAVSYYFREALHGKKDLHGYTYLLGQYDQYQWKLYLLRLNDTGININFLGAWNKPTLHAGDKIVANFPEAKTYLESNYQYRLVEDFYGVRNYVITGPK